MRFYARGLVHLDRIYVYSPAGTERNIVQDRGGSIAFQKDLPAVAPCPPSRERRRWASDLDLYIALRREVLIDAGTDATRFHCCVFTVVGAIRQTDVRREWWQAEILSSRDLLFVKSDVILRRGGGDGEVVGLKGLNDRYAWRVCASGPTCDLGEYLKRPLCRPETGDC